MPPRRRRKTLLIFSQVFIPDPASVGQHVADVAVEMARRGHRVRVYASARGYEDPSRRYPARENLHGVDVRRLPLSSFGKKSILTRLIGTAAFMAQVLFVGLTTRDLGGIFFSTSPPMIGLVASVVRLLRGVPTAYWAMDLNPDQVIALGKVKPTDLPARAMEVVNRLILRQSSLVVALDRFMADRLAAREPLGGPVPLRDKMLVMPPWPHEDHIASPGANGPASPQDPDANPFRARHGLAGKFVVMYSGNHSPSNPLQTLLDAAERFRDHPALRFAFVGGGIGKRAVEAFVRDRGLTNCLLLPYQPLSELRYSIPAADVHVVSLGSDMVGIIHPCKVYGAMAAARPVLFLGPRPSHVSDLVEQHLLGWHVAHGDVDGAVRTIEQILATPTAARAAMGERARRVLRESLGQRELCGRLCDALERSLALR